jgi:putative spermidine/putrescine transport system ATP-binding protein
MTSNYGLEIRNLHKELGGRVIIDNLNLTVESHELVSLLGPSGCGKTTTLRMVAGFMQPDAGSIIVDGKDVTPMGAERRPSAMVFQNYALWPHMTVAKNVGFPLKIRGLGKKQIEERVEGVLALVNLLHHKQSRPSKISGGEQQRVALARALVQEPSLLLLDEPLSNLDAKLRVKVREDIRDIQQRLGITTILVTHDQEEALSMSDRIAVMNAGRIEQYSTPSELYDNPKTEFVASFIGSLNKFDADFVDGQLVPGSAVTGIRPEHVFFSQVQSGNAQPAEVVRVVPRGHFSEVYLKRVDASLRAFASGDVPHVGQRGFAGVEQAMTFRDGVRVS